MMKKGPKKAYLVKNKTKMGLLNQSMKTKIDRL